MVCRRRRLLFAAVVPPRPPATIKMDSLDGWQDAPGLYDTTYATDDKSDPDFVPTQPSLVPPEPHLRRHTAMRQVALHQL